ncbi:MAG: ribonuclease III [Actinobacteria bacterium]|nr:ribonuclease III [Actinomycetota bacterium]
MSPACTATGGAAGLLMELVHRLPAPLLEQALTHSSWVEERTGSYERLEFLGDSVLGLAVAAHLYERFPDDEEGKLAKLKAFVVSRRSCAEVARRLGVDELVRSQAPGNEEQRAELAASPTALGNIVEALIGAVYCTWGFEMACRAVVGAFAEQVEYGCTNYVDFKSTLQEYLAVSERTAVYRLVGEEGPPHERVFTSEVLVQGQVEGKGTGRTIKKSEQEAARRALARFGVLEPGGGESGGDVAPAEG